MASVEPARVADALALPGERVLAGDRLTLLAQCIEGVGVTITTGPIGAAFWTGVSPEVVVHIVPDNVELDERHPIMEDNGLLWSLRAAGLTETEAGALLRGRTRPPSQAHQHYERWQRAARLREQLLVLSEVEPLVEEDFEVTVIEDPAKQLEFLAGINEFCALDWEWDPYDPDTVDGLSVATRDAAYYLPVRASDYVSSPAHGRALRRLFSRRVLGGLPCVFHQGRADLSYQYDGDPAELSGRPIHDTLLMAFLAFPEAADLGLKPLTRQVLAREAAPFPGGLADIPLARGARYAAADTRNTFDLFQALVPILMEKDQWRVYMEYEQPLMPIVASMEKYGQPVDVPELQRVRDSMVEDRDDIRQAVQIGYGYDLASNDCTKDWLKEITGFRPGDLDQRGISKYPQGEVDVIITYRRNDTRLKNLGTAVRKWEGLGCPQEFYLYPKFNQAGKDNDNGSIDRSARTGRFTSSGSRKAYERAFGAPNFQNQPGSIRSIYCAPPGMRFTSWDYSAIELRVAAGISGDPTMLNALNSGEDLHDLFRQRVIELTGIDVGRTAAKSGNFEQLYGGGAAMLVRILRKMRAHITLEVADAIVRGHAATFPVYHEWARRTLGEARRVGYSETLFGRRRYLPELYSPDSEVRGNAERAAVNHVIQGTAADVIKLAMVRLSSLFIEYGGHLAITVHDEIDGWVSDRVEQCLPKDSKKHGCVHVFCNRVKEAMTSIEIPGIKLAVEGGVGPHWGAVH